MVETWQNYKVGERIEAKHPYMAGNPWKRATIRQFDVADYPDDDETMFVRFDECDGGQDAWRTLSTVRKLTGSPAAPRKMQFRRVGGIGAPSSEWSPLSVAEGTATVISIPGGFGASRIEIRYVPDKTESEILAELRKRAAAGGMGITNTVLRKVLGGDF